MYLGKTLFLGHSLSLYRIHALDWILATSSTGLLLSRHRHSAEKHYTYSVQEPFAAIDIVAEGAPCQTVITKVGKPKVSLIVHKAVIEARL
jgi:hypothetical protein